MQRTDVHVPIFANPKAGGIEPVPQSVTTTKAEQIRTSKVHGQASRSSSVRKSSLS